MLEDLLKNDLLNVQVDRKKLEPPSHGWDWNYFYEHWESQDLMDDRPPSKTNFNNHDVNNDTTIPIHDDDQSGSEHELISKDKTTPEPNQTDQLATPLRSRVFHNRTRNRSTPALSQNLSSSNSSTASSASIAPPTPESVILGNNPPVQNLESALIQLEERKLRQKTLINYKSFHSKGQR